MTHRALIAAVALGLSAARLLGAQGPAVRKVEPPNWWAGHSINPVRLLIRGERLTGARVECPRPRLTCANTRVNAAGTYAMVDVTIARGATGSLPLTLHTMAGSTPVPFEVTLALPRPGRFQGFGSDDVMYLLMPDRFANGDESNDDPSIAPGLLDRGRARYYHGGDLAGLRHKLAYLKSLGVTTVWMNPIYDNANHLNRRETYDGQAITDYHGYGAVDFYAVDEHLGTVADARRLVDEAHALGMKVVFDMVANHSGPYHPWATDAPTPTWYNGTTDRHLANTWQTWTLADPYSSAAMRQATLDGWFIDILPDLNQSDPDVARYTHQNTLWWVGMTGIDGIRQDTWPYVPRPFWRDWMTAIKREYPRLRVVGEVFDGNPAMIAFFEGGRAQWDGLDTRVDMMFDFPLFYPIRRAFGEGKSIREVAQMLSHDRLYREPRNLVTFLGLHDVGRFMNEPGATVEGLKLAYTFLFTTRGTPLIYYGDEIAMAGGNDPDNRRDFPGGWRADPRNAFTEEGRSALEQGLWSHLQSLARLRAARPDLRGPDTRHLLVGDQVYVYARGASLVALNNDTRPARVEVVIPASMGRRALADALGQCPVPTRSGERVSLTIPARTGCIF
jgi:glycosidase